MGAQQSKEARPEPELETAHSGVPGNGNTASPDIGREEGTEAVMQHRSPSLVTNTLPLPTSPSPSTVFGSNEYPNDGKCPKTPTTPNSSDDGEDLVTLLRKYRKCRGTDEKTSRGIFRPSWKPISFRLRTHLETHENELQKPGRLASPPKARKRSRSVDSSENRVDARTTKRRTQSTSAPDKIKKVPPQPPHKVSFSSSSDRGGSGENSQRRRFDVYQTGSLAKLPNTVTKSRIATPRVAPRLSLSHDNQIRHAKADNRGQISDIQRVKFQTTTPNTINKNILAPFQAAREPATHSNIKFAGSRVYQDGNLTPRIQPNGEHGIHIQKQPKRSHTAKNNKLAPFRRGNRNFLVHPDSVRESDIPEEPQQSKYVVSKIDSGGILDARPSTISEPRVQTDRDANQLARQAPAHIRRQPDNFFQMPHDLVEECESPLKKQLQSRQRPPETVVPESKFAYTINGVHSVDITPDNKDKRERVFADRKQANEYLDKITSPGSVIGNLGTIVSRTITLEGPAQLLKVDIALSNNKHYLLWVERSVVVLGNLKCEMRRQKQWKPNPRLKIPHYVVTCDLITYETSPVTRCDQDDDDDAVSLSSQDIGLGSCGTNVELRIEKLPLATFTFREMANKYAGNLFLETSKVTFPERSDVLWWERTALPKHKEAVAGARRPDGLYELAMDVDYMSARLGWNQILVHVHEVDDMGGPVNF